MRMTMSIKTLAAVALFATGTHVAADGVKTEEGARRGRGKGHEKHRSGEDAAASRDSKFRAWDRDGNGSISPGEYPGHPGNFRALDTDNSGGLTIDEFQHRAGVGAPEGSARMPDATPAERDEDFGRLDADSDGAISRQEWRGRRSSFDALDGDGNGIVTREEYRRRSTRSRPNRQG